MTFPAPRDYDPASAIYRIANIGHSRMLGHVTEEDQTVAWRCLGLLDDLDSDIPQEWWGKATLIVSLGSALLLTALGGHARAEQRYARGVSEGMSRMSRTAQRALGVALVAGEAA